MNGGDAEALRGKLGMVARGSTAFVNIAVALGLAAAVSGCSTLESLVPTDGTPKSATSPTSDPVIHNVPETAADKAVVLPLTALELDCPAVEVVDGAATQRFGGPANTAVRYQFDITSSARECQPAGANFTVKVGVSGLLLIGPAGSPGAYSSNVKVRIKREADQKYVFEKSYHIEANTNGDARAPFRIVTEPISLPYTRPQLNDDYSIFVGFGDGGVEKPHKVKPKPPRTSAN